MESMICQLQWIIIKFFNFKKKKLYWRKKKSICKARVAGVFELCLAFTSSTEAFVQFSCVDTTDLLEEKLPFIRRTKERNILFASCEHKVKHICCDVGVLSTAIPPLPPLSLATIEGTSAE